MSETFPARFGCERDAEVPLFLEWLAARKPSSLLDVGAHYSHAYYAREAAAIMAGGTYTGLDLADCPLTREILMDYIVGDIMEGGPAAKAVSCISTLEHFGADLRLAGERAATKRAGALAVIERAQKSFFLSFPFGEEGHMHGHYSNLTPSDVYWITAAAERGYVGYPFTVEARFYGSDTPICGGWHEISREQASRTPLRPERGVEAICILTGDRE